MFYNIVLVSVIQHYKSVITIYIYILPLGLCLDHPAPQPSCPSRSSQNARLGPLCYTVTSHQLSVLHMIVYIWGFPGGSEVKTSACNAGDLGSIPGLGKSPGEGNGNPLQYSCLKNPMYGGAFWATVHGVTKSQT